jgi:hypothetical protein
MMPIRKRGENHKINCRYDNTFENMSAAADKLPSPRKLPAMTAPPSDSRGILYTKLAYRFLAYWQRKRLFLIDVKYDYVNYIVRLAGRDHVGTNLFDFIQYEVVKVSNGYRCAFKRSWRSGQFVIAGNYFEHCPRSLA